MDRGQAAYFLANYPALFEWMENNKEDVIINRYRQTAFAGGNRRGGHSDPTARKAERVINCQHITDAGSALLIHGFTPKRYCRNHAFSASPLAAMNIKIQSMKKNGLKAKGL
ncbi:MAG: hypothetical protein ACYDEQ_05015 [Desulfocucumaceae bacterium]